MKAVVFAFSICAAVYVCAGSCTYNGKVYQRGQKVPKPNPCGSCVCMGNDRISCMTVMCARPGCVDSVKNANDCCRRCPNGYNCRLLGRIVPTGRSVTISRKKCVVRYTCTSSRYGISHTESRSQYC